MSGEVSKPCTAFEGEQLLLRGPLLEVALAVKAASGSGASTPVLVFDDKTGQGTARNLCGPVSINADRTSQVFDRRSGIERAGTAQAGGGFARGDAPAEALGLAGHATGRRLGDRKAARRGREANGWSRCEPSRRPSGGLSRHAGDGRQSAGL